MLALLMSYVTEGRSTPGAPQKNDTPVNVWPKPAAAARE
jgi:hypothetical protein